MAVIWLNWVEGRANEQRGDGQGGRGGGAEVQSGDRRCPDDGGGSFYPFFSHVEDQNQAKKLQGKM